MMSFYIRISNMSIRYEDARKKFILVAKKIKKFHFNIQPEKWEPLYNNLGHVFRKLK